MMKKEYQPVARINYQAKTILQYSVASKRSKPGGHHVVRFKIDGTRFCSCVGHEWLRKKVDDMLRDCRHKKLVTIYSTENKHPLGMLIGAREYLKHKQFATETAWGNIFCQFPENYMPTALYCEGCPLYPEVCNIHKIHVPGKRNKLPLVWKLQGQIYAGKRKDATKTIRKIIKEIEARSYG